MYRKPRVSRSNTTSREVSPDFPRSLTTPVRGFDIAFMIDEEARADGLGNQLRESKLVENEAISSMKNWIESVGKPALETQEILYVQIQEKDTEWERTMIELEALKQENRELQQSLEKRPTSKQHENESWRATRLEISINRLEQQLHQKEQALRSLTRQAKKIMRSGKQLESNKTQLANTLSKVTRDFASQLQRATKRNMSLESTVVEKENDIVRLMDTMRAIGKKGKNKLLLRGVVGRMNQTLCSQRRSKNLKTVEQRRCTPCREAQAAAQAVTSRELQLRTPSRCESLCSTAPKGQNFTLSDFLDSITTLSRRVEESDIEVNGPNQIKRSLTVFQEEIQRCIKNLSQGEAPREEILGLLERVFDE